MKFKAWRSSQIELEALGVFFFFLGGGGGLTGFMLTVLNYDKFTAQL